MKSIRMYCESFGVLTPFTNKSVRHCHHFFSLFCRSLSLCLRIDICTLLKRLSLSGGIFLCFIFVPFLIQGIELESVTFILPWGYPYKEVGFQSESLEELILRFGDTLKVNAGSTKEGILWYHCMKDSQEFYLPEMLVVQAPRGIIYDREGNISIGRGRTDRSHPLPLSYKPNDLVPIPVRYRAEGYEERRIMLRREAAESFMRLIDDAQREGVVIRMISGFRDAKYQSYLYRNALKRHGMFQKSVAKPGHSEHQLGTACDLTSNEIRSALSVEFETTSAFRWLMKHGYAYGIALSYPKYKKSQTGYIYEPWHYRFWSSNRWENYLREHSIFFK